VFGAGGAGGYFGGRLAQAGHDVTFIARGPHLAALRERGLHVESVHGDFVIGSVRATDRPESVGPVDVLVLGVKTWQLPTTLDAIGTMVGPGTSVLTTQNGVEAPEEVARSVGRERTFPGIARIFAHVRAPGVIAHIGGPASLTFAGWDAIGSRPVERLRSALWWTLGSASTSRPTSGRTCGRSSFSWFLSAASVPCRARRSGSFAPFPAPVGYSRREWPRSWR
jgi:2-dehydropantoate 2-reductase